jgi:hypothetical protein
MSLENIHLSHTMKKNTSFLKGNGHSRHFVSRKGEKPMKRQSVSIFVMFFVLTVSIFSHQGVSQQVTQAKKAAAAQPQPSTELTVDQVIKLVQSGLSENLIIAKIRQNGKVFNLTTDEMIQLQTAKVSENIIGVMMDPQAQPAPPAPTPVREPESEKPTREPGFYVSVEGKEVLLDPSVVTGSKVGMMGVIVTGGFGKVKEKAVVRGAKSNARVSAPTEFVFVAGNGLTHPNELSIVKFSIEKGSRVFQVGEVGMFTGAKTGISDKDTIPFKAEKIGPGTFKLVLDKPLEPGEYAFMCGSLLQVSATGTTGKIWDFGIDK